MKRTKTENKMSRQNLPNADENLLAIDAPRLRQRIDRLLRLDAPRYRRLYAYYRNPMRPLDVCASADSASQRPYRQAQEWGLPPRITGIRAGQDVFAAQPLDPIHRKEVVIENDIAWRIDTMVDYLFGKPLSLRSDSPDPDRRAVLQGLAHAILEHNGGLRFLQQLALLGAVYGFVDVLVKFIPDPHAPSLSSTPPSGEPPVAPDASDPSAPSGNAGSAGSGPAGENSPPAPTQTASDAGIDTSGETGASHPSHDALIQRLARTIRLEIVEPARALPILSPADCRTLHAYAQCYEIEAADLPDSGAARHRAPAGAWWQRLLRSADRFRASVGEHASPSRRVLVTEIVTPARWQRYEDQRLVAHGENSLGEIPLAHIQNTSLPFEYPGLSDVEPLIPLQDELNTRLSDRASRITLQSFKMYLGKGIEHFIDMPVSPGRMWMTDNEKAEVVEFGGDADNPAESLHIADLREAMDKTSGVSPVAAGVIKNRVGRLTSAAALRLTLISLLARTEKKRSTYGQGVMRMLELAFAWLERAGLFHTDPAERRLRPHWANPLPDNAMEKLQEAEAKTRLGIAKEVVLKELGY